MQVQHEPRIHCRNWKNQRWGQKISRTSVHSRVNATSEILKITDVTSIINAVGEIQSIGWELRMEPPVPAKAQHEYDSNEE
jgi:hypothetical protein